MSRCARLVPRLLLALLTVGTPVRAGALEPAPAPAAAAPHDHDRLLAAVAVSAFALAAGQDLAIARAVRDAAPSHAQDDAARVFRSFGEPVVVGGALVAVWGAARLKRAPALEHAAVRSGLAIAAPCLVALALKEAFGRDRPDQSPDRAWELEPFHGDASLPSGHTTLAFAAATALTRETRARWTPWLAYPLAAATGWSRIHDHQHWTSDVVAGAALGYWGARVTDDALRRRDGVTAWRVTPAPGGWRAAWVRSF